MKKEWIDRWIERYGEQFRVVSRQIWEYAETGLHEEQSAAVLCQTLLENGFSVEHGLAGIPTAFVGSFGIGSPVIGILGEFDALEGLSQEAGSLIRERKRGEHGRANGHGCGHNLLGSGSLAAAAAVKAYMEEKHITSGTVKYFGCPGEERGCGKTFMMRDGCFSGLDSILTWHPLDCNEVDGKGSLADLCINFRFIGKSAHASTCPHLGRSALDAVELLNVGCNYMREHIIPDARIHYAITDAGGTAPNVIPGEASVAYEVRAPRLKQAVELSKRVCKAAQGAAMMTETEVEISYGDGYSDYVPNDTLNRVAWEKMNEIGGPEFTEADREFAKAIGSTYENEIDAEADLLPVAVLPYHGLGGVLPASTDVGDASYAAPTMQIHVTCCAVGTPGHSWQMVSQAGAPLGETGMLTAAKVLAMTAAELLENPLVVEKAKKEHERAVKGKYICPISAGRKPDC